MFDKIRVGLMAALGALSVLLLVGVVPASADMDCAGDGSPNTAADFADAEGVVVCVSEFAEAGITQVAPILIGTIAFLALLGFLMLVWRRVRGFVRGMGSKRSA